MTNVVVNVAENIITGTTIEMQYSLDSTDGTDGTWINAGDPETAVTFAPGEVYVREIGNNTNYRLVAIIEQPAAAPNVTFSFDGVDAGKLMGSTAEMEYSLDNGNNWNDVAENDVAFISAELASITHINDIRVRVAATNASLPGYITVIDILAQDQPSASVSAATDIITGVESGVIYEIDLDRDGAFDIEATADNDNEIKPVDINDQNWDVGDEFDIRAKAGGNALASPIQTVTVNPFIITTDTHTRPAPPAGYRISGNQGIAYGEYYYWPWDDINNMSLLIIVAYDDQGVEIQRFNYFGNRYVSDIAIDSVDQKFNFSVQGNVLSINWSDLDIMDD